MAALPMTPAKVLALCREKDVKAVDLRFMDFPGLWQHFTVPVNKLDEDVFVCPSLYGGRIWQATAYDPNTKALFMPLANMCNAYKVVEQPPTPGEDYGRGRFSPRP